MLERVKAAREKEAAALRRQQVLTAFSTAIGYVAPLLVTSSSFYTYTRHILLTARCALGRFMQTVTGAVAVVTDVMFDFGTVTSLTPCCGCQRCHGVCVH